MVCHHISEVVFHQGSNMAFVLLTLIGLCNLLVTKVTANEDVCNLSPAGIIPEVPYYLEHEDVVLECFTYKPSKHLTFLLGMNKTPVDVMCNKSDVSKPTYFHRGIRRYPVESMCIWERNETYVKLVIPRVTANDVKEYKQGKHVKCIDAGDNPYTCKDNAYIQLEYFPIEPENITCIVDNFETLYCSWDLGPVYKFPRNMTITCQYAFNVSTKINIDPKRVVRGWSMCPNSTSTSCFWDSHQYHNSRMILINVSVTNLVRNITVSKNTTVYRDKVLKPSKVTNLTVQETEDPTCVDVSWTPPFLFRNYTKYNITYSSQCGTKEKVEQMYCVGDYTNYCWFELCHLNPYTVYNLDIVSRFCPDWEETGYWSEPAETTFRTRKARPKKGPTVTEGLYQYDGKHLTLYWQPLGVCDQYAGDTVYEVTINGMIKSYPASDFVMEIRLLHQNTSSQEVDILIQTKNTEGTADTTAGFQVLPENIGPKDSELIIEYKRNETGCEEYLATIKVDTSNYKKFSTITHTVAWCNITAGACNSPMDWLENVTAGSRIPLPVQDCNETYRFWLITKGFHSTAQKMVWTDLNAVHCKYLHNMVPTEPLPKVRLSKVSKANTVTVEWEPYPCREPIGYIENYIVTYCEARKPQTNHTCDCIQKREEVFVSNKKSVYTVENLSSNLEICVWVSAKSLAGQGPKNRHVLFHIVESGEGGKIAIIVLACVFPFLFILVIVGITIQYCRKRIKSVKKEFASIEDPLMNQGSTDEEGSERDGHHYPIIDKRELVPIPDVELPDNQDEGINLYQDSDTENSPIDSKKGIDGYEDASCILDSSMDSVNSELTDVGGNAYVDKDNNHDHNEQSIHSEVFSDSDAHLLDIETASNNLTLNEELEVEKNDMLHWVETNFSNKKRDMSLGTLNKETECETVLENNTDAFSTLTRECQTEDIQSKHKTDQMKNGKLHSTSLDFDDDSGKEYHSSTLVLSGYSDSGEIQSSDKLTHCTAESAEQNNGMYTELATDKVSADLQSPVSLKLKLPDTTAMKASETKQPDGNAKQPDGNATVLGESSEGSSLGEISGSDTLMYSTAVHVDTGEHTGNTKHTSGQALDKLAETGKQQSTAYLQFPLVDTTVATALVTVDSMSHVNVIGSCKTKEETRVQSDQASGELLGEKELQSPAILESDLHEITEIADSEETNANSPVNLVSNDKGETSMNESDTDKNADPDEIQTYPHTPLLVTSDSNSATSQESKSSGSLPEYICL